MSKNINCTVTQRNIFFAASNLCKIAPEENKI